MKDLKFKPIIIDYPEIIRHRVLSDDERKMVEESAKRMSAMFKDAGAHIILNGYIYLEVRENGMPTRKQLRIRVDGGVYKKLMEWNEGKLPQYVEVKLAESLDAKNIY